MKKVSIVIAIMLMGFLGVITQQVNAEEIYYENEKGVVFTKEQYDFFTAAYYDGFQKIMSQKEFDYFKPEEMKKELVESKVYEEYINPMGTEVSSSAKRLKISKISATSNVKVTLYLEWLGTPTVRSYDLMGAYLSGTSIIGTPSTLIGYSGGSYYSNEIQSSSAGFGVSLKLPDSGSNIKISQTYTVNYGGRVYGSYQHAMNNVSLSTSKNYTIGYAGFGHVFIFNFGAGNNYDGFSGVDIDV